MIDVGAFEDHLDRFGGDLGRWPVELAREAEALLAASPQARAAKAATDAVEAYLRTGSPAARSPDTALGMAASAMRQRQITRATRSVLGGAWGAAAAAALVLGVMVGHVQSTGSSEGFDDSPDQVVTSALDATGTADVD